MTRPALRLIAGGGQPRRMPMLARLVLGTIGRLVVGLALAVRVAREAERIVLERGGE